MSTPPVTFANNKINVTEVNQVCTEQEIKQEAKMNTVIRGQ